VTPAAAAVLRAYPWPGNVRELRNAAERLVLLQPSRPLTAADVPVEFRTASSTDTRPIAAHHRSVGGDALWERMAAGEDFWTVVAQPLKRHQITRNDLTSLIHRGLTETGGRYSLLLQVFNLPRTDYKRFHAFLYQHQCNLPVGSYRAMAKSPVPVSTQPIPLRAVS
jgi:DNA-binding NtrC family response regulator